MWQRGAVRIPIGPHRKFRSSFGLSGLVSKFREFCWRLKHALERLQ